MLFIRTKIVIIEYSYNDKFSNLCNLVVYLLDDILSALDTHVTTHIVKHCILGLLKNKTRIVVTENKCLYFHADQILHVENGTVTQSEYESRGSFDSDFELEIVEEAFKKSGSVELGGDGDTKSVDSVMMEVSLFRIPITSIYNEIINF